MTKGFMASPMPNQIFHGILHTNVEDFSIAQKGVSKKFILHLKGLTLFLNSFISKIIFMTPK